MDELRKDPILDRWVVVAPARAARPHVLHEQVETPSGACPFCAGSEAATPGEVYAIRDAGTLPNTPGWQLRVVPNKFPALRYELADDRLPDVPQGKEHSVSRQVSDELFRHAPACGVHEVIIESPRHVVRADELDDVAWGAIVEAYRARLAAWRGSSLACGMVFKNVGAAAGASLPHVHSQVLVLPWVPPVLADELLGALDYFYRHQRCVFCALIEQEQAAGVRVVMENDDFVAFCPYASRFPYEAWILPKGHAGDFDRIAPPQAASLGKLLRQIVRRIEAMPAADSYNLIVHTSPFDSQGLSHYHWHIELTPRGTRLAGFELGTGYYINPLPPEVAAEQLRSC